MSRPIWLALVAGCLFGCATPRQTAPVTQLPPVAAAPQDPGGVGSLEVRAPNGDPAQARLVSVHVSAEQRGDMAEIEATHTFHNDADAVVEGTFRFPMPDGALLTGLAMMIDGKLMQGELVEREKARKAYEAVVDGMQDPALLEWEHGSVFKMRVFPMEPKRDKVVVIRYLTPLWRGPEGLSFVQSAPLAELSIDWQGKRAFAEKNVEAGRLITLPARPTSARLREDKPDGSYGVVRLSPDWRRVPAPKRAPAQNWFIVVDTSRSALEELPRALEGLSAVLAALPPDARFQVVTSDLEARPAPQGLTPVTASSVADALAFVKSVTPDGASDLGSTFQSVGKLVRSAKGSAVVYLGDCEPTWGVTDTKELSSVLRRELPQVPLYPLMFGASVNDELAAELAQASGGRRARIRRQEDLNAFVETLVSGVPTLENIRLRAPVGTELLTSGPLSLEPGRDLLVYVKAPPGRDPLAGLSAEAGTLDLLPHGPSEPTSGVAKRFGAAWVKKLEKDGKPPADVVKASLAYGVMSKLTSFLVLESEEAYARFSIERKREQAADAPRVTGANLESTSGADISADRIQPGDPEILIEAERSALQVSVEFPFGETKLARWDADARGGRGAWLVRFLVPRNTPEGDYEALAHITHEAGALETRKVRYTVDNTAPELQIELSPARREPSLVQIFVTSPGDPRMSDLKRVELLTPSGTTYELVAIRWGVFRAFVPKSELGRGTLRVVGFDLALNHAVKELELP